MPALPARRPDDAVTAADRPNIGALLAASLRAILDRLVVAQREVAPEFFRHPFP